MKHEFRKVQSPNTTDLLDHYGESWYDESWEICIKCSRFKEVVNDVPCTVKNIPTHEHNFVGNYMFGWYKCKKCGLSFSKTFISKNKHILKCHVSDDEYMVKDIIE